MREGRSTWNAPRLFLLARQRTLVFWIGSLPRMPFPVKQEAAMTRFCNLKHSAHHPAQSHKPEMDSELV